MADKIKIDEVYSVYFNALLKGDKYQCSQVVHALVNAQMDVRYVYEHLFKPAMYEVGNLWERNKITVATEHMASAITESIMNELYGSIAFNGSTSKSVVVTCIESELHQIGARMISDVFELNHWQVKFLGANTPNSELVNFLCLNQPAMLAISVSLYFNLPTAEELIMMVREHFQLLPIVVGGQAFSRGGHEIVAKFNGVTHLPDVISMDRYLKNLDKNGQGIIN